VASNDASTPGTDLYNYLAYRSNNYEGRGIFTPQVAAYAVGSGDKIFRPMGDVNAGSSGNANLDSQWRYRMRPEMASWGTGFVNYPPGAWTGGYGTTGNNISYSAVASSGCT
jgi:hypothetical protein